MELSWWPVAVVGMLCAVVAVALALALPARGARRTGPALAHTDRLTGLPEYRAVLRQQRRSAAVVLVLLVMLFISTLVASARPSGSVATSAESDADIMLCVAQPVTDEATGQFLGYFARRANTFGLQRIGLTSTNRRLVPLTRDYQFVAERLGDYAGASRSRAESIRGDIQSFTAPVEYTDYAPTLADVLGVCLTGFPGFPAAGDTRRSVIYLGPGELRAPGDDRPSLYTDAQITDLARRAGVQIDAVATAGRPTDALAAITSETGGRFARYDQGALAGQLDTIEAARTTAQQSTDTPVAVLVVAMALAALLAVCLPAVPR